MAQRTSRTGEVNTSKPNINYYSIKVIDATGNDILPPVKKFGPRGERAFYGIDKNGGMVEIGWTKKIDLYLIVNDTTKKVSERLQAIDSRIADATNQGLAVIAMYESITTPDMHSIIYQSVPIILSIAGLAAGGTVGAKFGGIVGKLIERNLPNDDSIIMMLKAKASSLNYELNKLTVLRNGISGEYLSLDSLGDKLNVRSANTTGINQNTVLAGLGLVGLGIYLRRSKK